VRPQEQLDAEGAIAIVEKDSICRCRKIAVQFTAKSLGVLARGGDCAAHESAGQPGKAGAKTSHHSIRGTCAVAIFRHLRWRDAADNAYTGDAAFKDLRCRKRVWTAG